MRKAFKKLSILLISISLLYGVYQTVYAQVIPSPIVFFGPPSSYCGTDTNLYARNGQLLKTCLRGCSMNELGQTQCLLPIDSTYKCGEIGNYCCTAKKTTKGAPGSAPLTYYKDSCKDGYTDYTNPNYCTCTALKKEGQECEYSDECESDLCNSKKCTTKINPLPPPPSCSKDNCTACSETECRRIPECIVYQGREIAQGKEPAVCIPKKTSDSFSFCNGGYCLESEGCGRYGCVTAKSVTNNLACCRSESSSCEIKSGNNACLSGNCSNGICCQSGYNNSQDTCVPQNATLPPGGNDSPGYTQLSSCTAQGATYDSALKKCTCGSEVCEGSDKICTPISEVTLGCIKKVVSNDTPTSPIQIPLSDLLVSSGPFVPRGLVGTGISNFRFSGSIKNNGNGETEKPFTVIFCLDCNTLADFKNSQKIVGSIPIQKMVAGAIQIVSSGEDWKKTPGKHVITVCADMLNTVGEFEESNNCEASVFYIQASCPLNSQEKPLPIGSYCSGGVVYESYGDYCGGDKISTQSDGRSKTCDIDTSRLCKNGASCIAPAFCDCNNYCVLPGSGRDGEGCCSDTTCQSGICDKKLNICVSR